MADGSVERKRPAGRIAFAAGVGNFMEWFDFAIYGFFAVTLGAVFFPSQDPTVQLLSALAVFGVAFFMRPLGGVLLGAVGDRLGRRASLSASVLLMGISTSLVAALPTYEQVGILAPVLLVVLRCMQGLSAGGEWTGASASIAFPGAAAFYMVGVAAVSCLVLVRYLPETLWQPLDDRDDASKPVAPIGSEQASATALARN